MSFDPDIAEDLTLCDGTETVTLVSTVTVSVAGAKRGQQNTAQTASAGGVFEPTQMIWLLPAINLGDIVPRPGDTITDGGETSWTITSAGYSPLSQVWRIESRRQR